MKNEEEKKDVSPTSYFICDLTNNEELRLLLKRIWDEMNGIDLVINCEIEDPKRCRLEIGQRVETIGSNIQLMINVREICLTYDCDSISFIWIQI